MMLAPPIAASSTRRIITCALEIGSSPAPAQHCLPLLRWHHSRRNCRSSASTVVSPPLKNVSPPSQRKVRPLLPKRRPRRPSRRLPQNPRLNQNRLQHLSLLRHLSQNLRQLQNRPRLKSPRQLPYPKSRLNPLLPLCRKWRPSQLRHPNRLRRPCRKQHPNLRRQLRLNPFRRLHQNPHPSPRPVRLSSQHRLPNSLHQLQNLRLQNQLRLPQPSSPLRPNSLPPRSLNSPRLRPTFPQACRPRLKTTTAPLPI